MEDGHLKGIVMWVAASIVRPFKPSRRSPGFTFKKTIVRLNL
jgi:hypothetical protein